MPTYKIRTQLHLMFIQRYIIKHRTRPDTIRTRVVFTEIIRYGRQPRRRALGRIDWWTVYSGLFIDINIVHNILFYIPNID